MAFAEDWARCRAWIEAALPYAGGTHDIDDVKRAIGEGRAFLLTGDRSAFVCEVVQYPRLRVLRIWLAGGDMTELKSAHDQMVALGRLNGCSRLTISGRKGWERALADLGFNLVCTTIAKEIS